MIKIEKNYTTIDKLYFVFNKACENNKALVVSSIMTMASYFLAENINIKKFSKNQLLVSIGCGCIFYCIFKFLGSLQIILKPSRKTKKNIKRQDLHKLINDLHPNNEECVEYLHKANNLLEKTITEVCDFTNRNCDFPKTLHGKSQFISIWANNYKETQDKRIKCFQDNF